MVIIARDYCASGASNRSAAFLGTSDHVNCPCYLSVRVCVVLREHRRHRNTKGSHSPMQREYHGCKPQVGEAHGNYLECKPQVGTVSVDGAHDNEIHFAFISAPSGRLEMCCVFWFVVHIETAWRHGVTSWGLLGSNRGWGPVVPDAFLLHGPRLVLTPKAHLGSPKSLCTSREFLWRDIALLFLVEGTSQS